MKIEEYLDKDKLQSYIERGLVTASVHPTLPLVIFTYGRSAVHENLWDDITIKCRDLCVADDGTIVARPYEKFFNIETSYRPETHLCNLPTERPLITEKLDGSLGILWRYEGHVGIASKGSFKSDHAIWATKFYNENHKDAIWPDGWTPVFEMICQEVQTHVVHYKEKDHLALTGMVNIETGEEATYDQLLIWGAGNNMPVVESFNKSIGQVLAEDRPNKEGYVLTWHRKGQPPLKVKVKHETFLAMQKIAHEATPKAILEALSEGRHEQVELWAKSANPELAAFVQGHAADFRAKFVQILQIAGGIAATALEKYETRKDQAAFLLKDEGHKFFSPLAFAFLDKKGPDTMTKIVWKLVKEQEKELSDKPMLAPDEEDAQEV